MPGFAGSYAGRRGQVAAVSYTESAVVFRCSGHRLIGVIARPLDHPLATGVLILVGGPQYRAGSHRQFTLLARDLAQHGIASLRFDYRGMGDSEGDPRPFDEVNDDIRAAIDTMITHEPRVRSIVIWGLCDAASAALIYGHRDPRVSGLILLNPWVHTEASAARARLRHYYLRRLADLFLWQNLFSGHVRIGQSLRDLINLLRAALGQARFPIEKLDCDHSAIPSNSNSRIDQKQSAIPNFIERMHRGAGCFKDDILCILSGNDLIALEFESLINQDPDWRNVCRSKRISRHFIPQADHTFSSYEWREAVSKLTVNFVANRIIGGGESHFRAFTHKAQN